ncbi:MAG: hypothetical protein HFE76_17030 [Firmicutes bacterium]|nr:hypothetical protein [Bacillota bacterium]
MNPLALLVLAAAAGNGTHSSMSSPTVRLDTVLEQLHGAVRTLEKVSELSRIGSGVSNAFSLPPSASAHIPVSAQPVAEQDYAPEPQPPAQPAANFDIQGAMQALGPILSMLGNNQNPR